jgi:hypothetical protein
MLLVLSMRRHVWLRMMNVVTVHDGVGHLRSMPGTREDHPVLQLGKRPRERRDEAMLPALRGL